MNIFSGVLEEELLLFYIYPLVINAILGLFLALFIARYHLAPGARALLFLIFGASLWSNGYALELISPDLGMKLFWAKFQYFGIVTVPLAWFVFAVQHLGPSAWTQRLLKYKAFLAVLPILTLCLVWTNEIHHLVWWETRLVGPDRMLEIEHGPWFWVYLVFGYCLLLLGSIQLIRQLLTSTRLRHWQILLVLIATVIPWLSNLIYITGLGIIPHLDWTPVAFSASGLLFTISLFRFQLINILFVAQETVFTGLADCLVVLDPQAFIVDLNPAAQAMLRNPGEKAVGEPFTQILPELANRLAQSRLDEEFHVETTLGTELVPRFYDVHISPLTGSHKRPIGRLVVLHEITQHKLQHERLAQSNAQLEAAVLERTDTLRQTIEQIKHSHKQLLALTFRLQEVREHERRQIASELHDRIGQNLTGLNLNLQIIENQLGAGSGEAVRNRLDDSLKLVEETTRQVRDVMADLHPPALDEYGLVSALRWYSSNFSQRTGIAMQVIGEELAPRLPANVELVLFRILQEALNNVAKHAQATQVEVMVESNPETACFTVKDNGQGFDLQTLDTTAEQPHWGMLNMEQRAASIEGQLTIQSSPGQGTQVSVTIRRSPHED